MGADDRLVDVDGLQKEFCGIHTSLDGLVEEK